ncbi:YceI family protein [Aliarcobacter thereius]|uniref:YceI family protein n=1 Tax=Aliarcobacter thereius TaxID=544718 RepID=A0A5R9H5U8_9BACT|nr:YceI family protein [Aliarcobacter thereius]TLS72614.1 YceI family protein [Aliarcobacter thereius]
MSRLLKLMVVSAVAASVLTAAEYKVDTVHSNVGFSVKHMMVTNVNGKFTSYNSNFEIDEKTKTFKNLKAKIDTLSIDTGIKDRDDHLKSDDFFSASTYPEMSFEMTSYKADGDDGKMEGKLTLRGVTKNITLEVDDINIHGNKIGFALEGKIKRSDFGLKWNKAIELGGVAVGDEVKIKIDIEADRK